MNSVEDHVDEGEVQRKNSDNEEQVVEDKSEVQRSNDFFMKGNMAQFSDDCFDDPFNSDDSLRDKNDLADSSSPSDGNSASILRTLIQCPVVMNK